jgi:AraC-like DNA-binding protein
MLCGIAQYVREHGPWSIYYEPRALEEPVPEWLKKWRGDGIIARLPNRRIATAVAKTGLPVVDMLGVASQPGIPVVHPDDRAVGRLAAEHLLERGFRHCLVSRTELKRRFRRFLGRSIHDQIIRERLNEVEHLLATTEMPISQIARKAGFGSQAHMGVVFKARLGKTPGDYRKQSRP